MTKRNSASLVLLLLLGLSGLAACGRKDVPDYPPDAVERPGHVPQRTDPVHYY